ncbi:3'-5' exoribonuclease YhaM family protein [Bryobacter aggregatus]|uniref:3'-5' exoribonuclease YhaM family protein n=1 Tax=Bryobacter aggregatus TaxID=360054 RepID=UPI0004E1CB63|nr:OB-fold nucleic acid binding domain-containing protein [Bryobacter aggregatus]
MKSPYVSELQANSDITAVFLVQAKDVRQKKSGEPYLSLTLVDKSGDIDAKMWDNVEEIMDSFDRDDFVRVRGRVQIFQNKPQFTIHRMQKIEDREVDLGDFFPVSARGLEEMWLELRALIDGFTNPHLKALLSALFNDPEIARKYRIAPAAKSIHHAWLGGLLEHVLSLCALARMTAAHYVEVDLDLLLAGVILHDIGKIHELSYERSFAYSTEGQLLGHIIIALRMIDEKLRDLPDFPTRLRTLVEHMVVSHHGELAYGSPKTPMFLEALLLHHLDNLDSKMEAMRQHAKRDKSLSGVWTGYLAPMERTVLKKEKFLSESSAAPVSVPVAISPKAEKKVESGSLFGDKLKQALN